MELNFFFLGEIIVMQILMIFLFWEWIFTVCFDSGQGIRFLENSYKTTIAFEVSCYSRIKFHECNHLTLLFYILSLFVSFGNNLKLLSD